MFLKLADKLVKQGDYAGALQAIAKAKEAEPENRYANAYEERVRMLLRESGSSSPSAISPAGNPGSSIPPVPKGSEGMPSAEKQMNSIATLLQKSGKKSASPDQRHLAIQKKVNALLSSANQLLSQERFAEALDTVARAILLDATSPETRSAEERIRRAQEEARQRATKLRQEREQEELVRRERLLQEEVNRLKEEQERKRQQEESHRRTAQEQKVSQSLQRTRDFVNAGLLEEAQCELAFVSVLAPGISEVQALDAEIAHRKHEREKAAIEARRQEQEEERRRELELRKRIDETIASADALTRDGNFDEALRVLTDAYLLDPNNTDIEACEERIINARAAEARRLEKERLENEEALRLAMEEDRRRKEEAERARMREAEIRRDLEQRRIAEEQIANHLQAARAYLRDDQFKDALAEVALAFILNPFHADVKEMERTIMERQLQHHPSPEVAVAPPLPADDEEELEAIAKHLADAKRLAADRRFLPALHEIRKALELDPESIAAKKLASAFKQEFARTQEELRKSSSKSASGSAPANSSAPEINPGFGPEVDFVDQLIRNQLAETESLVQSEESPRSFALIKRWWVRVLLAAALGALAYAATVPKTDRPPTTPKEHVAPADPDANDTGAEKDIQPR
jgi:hypothetical protein